MHATKVTCPLGNHLLRERCRIPGKIIRASSVLVYPLAAETRAAQTGVKEQVAKVVAKFPKPIFTAMLGEIFELFS